MVCRYSWFFGSLRSRFDELGSKKKRMSFDSSGSPSSAACVAVRIGAIAIFCSENGLRLASRIEERRVDETRRDPPGFRITLP